MEKGRFFRNAVLMAAVAEAAALAPITPVAADSVPSSSVVTTQAVADWKFITCEPKGAKWYGFQKGDHVSVLASAVVIPSDVSVDGIKQYDKDADTSTVVGLKTKDNSDKTWFVDFDFSGSMDVLACKTGSNDLYAAIGRESARLDAINGLNNPTKRVNFNFIKK